MCGESLQSKVGVTPCRDEESWLGGMGGVVVVGLLRRFPYDVGGAPDLLLLREPPVLVDSFVDSAVLSSLFLFIVTKLFPDFCCCALSSTCLFLSFALRKNAASLAAALDPENDVLARQY